MSSIKLKHSGGNGVIISAPDTNPASDKTIKLPSTESGVFATKDSANSLQNVTGINGAQLSNRNIIINGAMQISQRSQSAVNIGGGKTYSDVDRFGQWTKISEGNWKSGQQVADAPTDFKYSRKITSLAANTVASGTYHTIRYAVEGLDAAQLNCGNSSAKTVTLSFYVKSSLTGTFGLNFTNSANNRSYATTYTISAANTWERKTITLTLDTSGTWLTDTGVGLEINWQLAIGSAYHASSLNQWQTGWGFPSTAANTLMTTNGATFQLTGVQLEVGSTATTFEHRSFGEELLKCQRYFQIFAAPNGEYTRFGLAAADASNSVRIPIHHIVEMRSKATFSYVGGNGDYQMPGSSNGFNLSQVIVENNTGSARSTVLQNGYVSVTAYQVFQFSANGQSNNAALLFSAEL